MMFATFLICEVVFTHTYYLDLRVLYILNELVRFVGKAKGGQTKGAN